MGTVSAKCGEAQIAANAALANPLVVGWLADAIVWAFDKLIEGARWLIDRIGELLQNAIAPVQMALKAFSWIDDVQKPMNTLSDSIQPRNLANDDQWSGVAAKAYRRGVETQDDAARAIAGVGATTVLGASSNAMIQTRTSMANFPGANWPVGTN